MAQTLNIACLQTRPKPDFNTALNEALELAEIAVGAGAHIITLPEYCGGLCTEGANLVPPGAPEDEHPVLQGLRNFANEQNVWMIIGSVAISGSTEKLYNRSFVIDDKGKILSRYDKIHLFDVELSESEIYRESAFVTGGSQAVVTETPFALIEHSVCYDLRFPGLYRDLAQAGGEVLIVPAAFTKITGEVHWHILNRARAIENGAFVVAPCAVGPIEGGGECYGHSLIVNPWGEVLVDGGNLPGVVQTTIDIDQVSLARNRIPSLDHDRPFTLVGDTQRPVA